MTIRKLILVTALSSFSFVAPAVFATTTEESTTTAATSGDAATAADTTAAADEPQYKVVDGMVDKPTFNGYRRFHGTCHACHGQDAAGGSFAPSLVDSLKTLDYAAFVKTVMEGRQVDSGTGGTSAMPAFANDPNITKHLDDIYAYVKARSDGAIGTGSSKEIAEAEVSFRNYQATDIGRYEKLVR